MSLTNKGRFIITVNNVSYEYKAQNINLTYESIMSENSAISDDGVYHPIFKKEKCQVEVVLPPMSAADISSIFSKIRGKEYMFSFWDLVTNTEQTIIAFTPNSQANCYSGILNSGAGLWQDATFTAIDTGKEVSNG